MDKKMQTEAAKARIPIWSPALNFLMSFSKRNQMPTKRYILILAFLSHALMASAQYTKFKYKRKNHSTEKGFVHTTRQAKYLSGGLGLNIQSYFGDLTPNERFLLNGLKTLRPGATAFASYNFSPILFFSGELSYGRIVGDDFNADPEGASARKYVRNLSFRNDLFGLTLRANVHVLPDPFEYYKRKDFNLYFFSGISFFYSNPKAKVPESGKTGEPFENAGEWVALRPLGTEGQNHPDYGSSYSPVQVGIPFGGGLRFKLAHRLDLIVEGSLHYILSDYIDDIGTTYPDLGVFDNELAKALSDRSMETIAVIKGKPRDQQAIENATQKYTYESMYDGDLYTVFRGFGEDGGIRGGDINDLIATFSF
jgi:hypothetical protein